MKKILLLAFLVLSLKSWASHLSGGWIEADVINSNTIRVKLKLITDCSGIPLGTSEMVTISGIPSTGTAAVISTTSFNLLGTMDVALYCNGVSSTCNGGTMAGFKLWTYEGIVQLPGTPPNNIRIYYNNCCRPFGVVNISNSGSHSYSIYTDLYSLNSIQNATPTKSSYDILANTADSNMISYSFIDLEADSLNYQLANTLDNANPTTVVPFDLGYSASNPLGSNLYSNLDAANGNYSFKTSTISGSYAVAFDLKEYRNGQLLSKTHGEQVILVSPISQTAGVFNFGATGISNKIFTPCATDSITYIADFNANDSILIDVDSLQNYPNATFSVTNISPTQKKAVFIWQAPFNAISLKKEKVVFNVTKFACPYQKKLTYTTIYQVKSCQQDSVWPGDINLDKTVNLIDGIYLAVAYNDSGSPRINPNINWTPQYANNWANSFNSGGNHKHADCDGNGTVQIIDAIAIAQNFNLSHPKNASVKNASKIASSVYDPTINFGNAGYTGTGSSVSVPVSIGDATKKVLGSNAVLFKIDANPAIIDGTTLSFMPNAGIISNANDIVVTQYKDAASADLYVAFVKKNNGIFSGFGNMGTLNFTIKSNASLGSTNLSVSQPELYAPNMYPQPVKSGPVKVLNVVLGLQKSVTEKSLQIAPNPFQNTLSVKSDKAISNYKIVDVTGKVIIQKSVNTNTLEINTDNLNAGIYFIEVISNGQKSVEKLVKE
jgi:hypothetical protein